MTFGWAVGSSVANALGDPLRKHLASEIRSAYLLNGVKSLIQLPVYMALAISTDNIPELNIPFIAAVLGSGTINFVTSVLYIRSLQLSPLSLTIPYLSFTPAFLLLVAFIMLGERTSLQGTLGVLIVSCGGFILHASSAPGRMKVSSLYRFASNPWNLDRGSLYMIAIAAIWSASASFDKIGTQHSSTHGFAGAVMLLHATLNLSWAWWEYGCPDMLEVCPRLLSGCDAEVGCNPSPDESVAEASLEDGDSEAMKNFDEENNSILERSKEEGDHNSSESRPEDRLIEDIRSLPILLLLASTILGGVSYWLHLRASASVQVSYAIAIKRAGCLVSIFVGKFFLGEDNLTRRLPGVLIMLFGVVLIVLQKK